MMINDVSLEFIEALSRAHESYTENQRNKRRLYVEITNYQHEINFYRGKLKSYKQFIEGFDGGLFPVDNDWGSYIESEIRRCEESLLNYKTTMAKRQEELNREELRTPDIEQNIKDLIAILYRFPMTSKDPE